MPELNQSNSKPTILQLMPWLVVLSAALFFFFDFIAMSTFDSLNAAISQSFTLDRMQISSLESLYFLAIIIFLMPAGVLLDRISTRKIILSAFMIMIVATLVFSLSHTYWIVATCRFATGIVATVCLMSCIRLTSRWFEMHYAGFVIGLVVTFAMLGGIVAQQLLKLDAFFGTWRHTLLALCAVGVVFWFICFVLIKDMPAHRQDLHNEHSDYLKEIGFWNSFFEAIKNPQTWLAGLYTNILSIPILVIGTLWGQQYLVHIKGISIGNAADMVSLIFLGMVIGSPISGWLSDKIKLRKTPMIIGAVLSFIIAMAICTTTSHSIAYLSVLFFLLGIIPSTQVISYPYLVEVNPLHITSTSTCLGATIIMSSGFIWTMLFGWISNRHAHSVAGRMVYPVDNFEHAFWILPITFAITIVIACCMKETNCEHIG